MSYRTPNFTMQQKLYFLQRIQGVVHTVQDFRKDTNTTVHRNAVWAEVVEAFNAAFPDRPPSSVGTMKTLWKRLKVESRQALHRRQEQVVAGMPVTALTEVQREITAMVPNLISNQDDMDGEVCYTGLRPGSPTAVTCTAATSGSDQDDADNSHNEESESKDQVAMSIGIASFTALAGSDGPLRIPFSTSQPNASTLTHSETSWSGTSPSFLPPPIPSASSSNLFTSCPVNFDLPYVPRAAPQPFTSLAAAAGRGSEDPRYGPRMLELSELEHEQRMRVLQMEQKVLEDKRKAVRQKEKAYRLKKRYYQAKLKKMGEEVRPCSSSEDTEGDDQII
ncbi:uncharacterized protein LOC118361317 [Oncorhynchus keta]|uniref:uncharacterized protein LOC118361317 n=1 Tax=Oncorhynchus keta TaxID=8018 RepID=UPI0015FE51E5|nr:uncharacterized protein LOC118361317 [Oncorhynchus keta]XP_046199389.1 uncharacterized protein LOC124031779 [Oncorhynchus gorbuscha]